MLLNINGINGGINKSIESTDVLEVTSGTTNPKVNDALVDTDVDGYSNLEEFRAGTNPTDASVNPGTVDNLHYKILASDGAANDYFGVSVALSGDTALIGANGDDDRGLVKSGAVYVYVRNASGDWIQQTKLIASDGGPKDYFGYSVALIDDTALIGAYGDSGNGKGSGSAYVFVRDADGSWIEQPKLVASVANPGGKMGAAVALSGDTALIGAYRDYNDGLNSWLCLCICA